MQTAFSDPPASVEFKMGPNGFVSPLNMILALREASSHSGMLHTNWYNFSRFCLRNVRKTPGQVMAYPDGVMGILNDIEKITYSNRRTTVRWLEGDGDEAKLKSEHMGCVDAGAKIKEQVEKFLSEDSKQLSKVLTKAQKAGAGENPAGMKDLENLIAQINVKGLKRGVEVAANILFWQTTNDVFNCGHLTLDPASYTSCASLLHDQQQTWAIDSAAAGSGFGRTVMASSSFLLALFFSLGPFVLLVVVAMAAQGFGLLVKYIIFGIWTQSWIPVAHIVNYFIIFSWKSSLERLEKAYEASGYTGKTLPLESVPRILSETVDAIAIAADLFAAVPLITLAVFTGSYFAFTRIADRFSSRDYTNERMIQPPPMQPAAMATMASAMEGNRGGGQSAPGLGASKMSLSASSKQAESASMATAYSSTAAVGRMLSDGMDKNSGWEKRFVDLLSSGTVDQTQLVNAMNHALATSGSDKRIKKAEDNASFRGDTTARALYGGEAGMNLFLVKFGAKGDTGTNTARSVSAGTSDGYSNEDGSSYKLGYDHKDTHTDSVKVLEDNSDALSNVFGANKTDAHRIDESINKAYANTQAWNSISENSRAVASSTEGMLYSTVGSRVANDDDANIRLQQYAAMMNSSEGGRNQIESSRRTLSGEGQIERNTSFNMLGAGDQSTVLLHAMNEQGMTNELVDVLGKAGYGATGHGHSMDIGATGEALSGGSNHAHQAIESNMNQGAAQIAGQVARGKPGGDMVAEKPDKSLSNLGVWGKRNTETLKNLISQNETWRNIVNEKYGDFDEFARKTSVVKFMIGMQGKNISDTYDELNKLIVGMGGGAENAANPARAAGVPFTGK